MRSSDHMGALNRVLIVDDNRDNLYMLQVLLSASGFVVDQATNGAEAIEQARKSPPDMIISDILMPVMDGYTLCRYWKRDEELKEIPFVFYTATYTDPKDEAFALNLGADRFIVKPVDPQQFLAMILETSRNYASGKPVVSPPPVEEAVHYKQYNSVLVRKLEDKMLQLERANQALKCEVAEGRRSLEQREMLVRELYHRTRNNMQVIRAILALRANRTKDPVALEIVRETDRRIQAMSLVHQMLYRSHDLTRIDLRQYVQELCFLLLNSYQTAPEKIAIEVEPASHIGVSLDLALPCGLILSELISNSVTHAFPGDRTGRIRIALAKPAPREVELRFTDDGAGLPAGFDPDQLNTLGFRAIITLTETQLLGHAIFASAGHGVTWTLLFREPAPDGEEEP